MKISVILPFRNAAPWLRECLLSLQAQTYPDLEFLLINDHSTDDSMAIASAFALTDPRFVLLQNSGKGLVEANACGLARASGELITRMDADDIMAPEKMAALAAPLLESGPGHLSTGYVRFFPDEHIGIGTRFYEQWLNARCDAGDHWDWIWRECVIPSPCWMAWKSDVLAVNAFDEEIYPDDYELAFRFWHAGLKVIPVRQVLHHWRQHSTRMSKKHGGFSAEAFTMLKWKWFRRIHIPDSIELFVLGHGKKARFLAQILNQENISFRTLLDWDKANRSYRDLPVKELNESIIISTLSSIDDYSLVYAALQKSGWMMHKDILRWC
jgi:glycosyltransferase involved in cell wall biosynthesis